MHAPDTDWRGAYDGADLRIEGPCHFKMVLCAF
jgi:hypothetical protein